MNSTGGDVPMEPVAPIHTIKLVIDSKPRHPHHTAMDNCTSVCSIQVRSFNLRVTPFTNLHPVRPKHIPEKTNKEKWIQNGAKINILDFFLQGRGIGKMEDNLTSLFLWSLLLLFSVFRWFCSKMFKWNEMFLFRGFF